MGRNGESSPYVAQLRETIKSGKAGFVIGAGVSAAATCGDAVALWGGLLHDGIRRCAYNDGTLGQDFIDRWARIVDTGRIYEMLAAGDVIATLLRDKNDFGPWLKQSVGKMKIKDDRLLKIIGGFGLPIATTNYDRLLEEATGLETASIRDGSWFDPYHDHDEPKVILHLHGHYRDDKSIVLGLQSYNELVASKKVMSRQLLLGQTRTLIFVGFGGSFRDPNFKTLMEWLADALEDMPFWHYQLVPSDELRDAVAAVPDKAHIRVLEYGATYKELPAFLEALRPRNKPTPGKPREEPPPARPINEESEYFKRFVGRERLLADFRLAMDGLTPSGVTESSRRAPRLWWVHGFGGMGKTTFLRRACVEVKHNYAGVIAYALIDWGPYSLRLTPLTATPKTPEEMFRPIAQRVAQCYGTDVLERFWSALDDVARHHDEHRDLHFRFDGAVTELQNHGPNWRMNLAGRPPAMQRALEEDTLQRDVHTLERSLRDRGLWSDDPERLRPRMRDLKNNVSEFTRVMDCWRELTLPPNADEALVSPVRVLAHGLRASLERACQQRPLLLVLDSCERLSPENDRWLRSLVSSLVTSDLPFMAMIGSESKPDAREPLGTRETWRGEIPVEHWRMEAFDETRLFTLEQIKRVIALWPHPVSATDSLAEILQNETRGVPLALTVALSTDNADLAVRPDSDLTDERSDESSDRSSVIRRVIEAVSQRCLLQLENDPDAIEDFRVTIAIAIQSSPNMELLRRLLGTSDPEARLASLESRYGISKGKELHLTVRSFVRRRWRERPPLELAEIARTCRALHVGLRPQEEDSDRYAAWLVEDVNLALWESFDAGIRLFPGRIAGVLALNSGADALYALVEELHETPGLSTQVPEPVERVLAANRSALDTAIHLSLADVEWLRERIDTSSSPFERASLDLVAGLVECEAGTGDQRAAVRGRERLAAAIRYFEGRLLRSSQVVRAYGLAVAATSTRDADDMVVGALALLRDGGLLRDLDLRIHAVLVSYAGDVDEAPGMWTKAMGDSPSASDYRGLGYLHSERSGESAAGEAEAAFRRAAEIEPDVARNWTAWALLEIRRGKKKLARTLLAKATRCPDGRSDPEALNNIAWAMYRADEDLVVAERFARKAYEKSDGDIKILHTLLSIEIHRGNWTRAKAHLRRVLESETPAAPRLYWSSIYDAVGQALARHGADTLSLLRSLDNAQEWSVFTSAAERVVTQGARRRPPTKAKPAESEVDRHYRELHKAVRTGSTSGRTP